MLGIALSPEYVNKPVFLLTEAVWLAFAAGLLAGALRSKSHWVRASLGALSLSLLAWHVLAVIPSWWLYFAESPPLNWGGQGCVSLSTSSEASRCIKQVVKDVIVVVELGAGFTAFIVGFLIFQRRSPKQLATGEAKPEATGGYK